MAEARQAAERLLHQLLPLDDERRAESEVWLAFTGHALVDPGQRAIDEEIHDQLHGACASAVTALADAGRVATPVDLELDAGRLHAHVDGLAVHATMHPARLPPPQVVAILARHLDSLESRP